MWNTFATPHKMALVAVVAVSAVLALRWAFLVPIFQSPDEDIHFDYAIAINEQRHLFSVTEHLPSGFAHPFTEYLQRRAGCNEVRFAPASKVAPSYGTGVYYRELDEEAPPRSSCQLRQTPSLASTYPFGYYAVLALWLEFVRMVYGDGPVGLFFGARLFSVFLLCVTLPLLYGTAREIGTNRFMSLILTAVIGWFPMVSFVGSYVQPDNLAMALVAWCSYLGIRLYRRPHCMRYLFLLGPGLGLLAVTKPHYFVVVLAAVSLVIVARCLSVRPNARQICLGLALLVLPIFFFWSIHASLTWGVKSPYVTTVAHANTIQVLERFSKAIRDYYQETTHQSFWGIFGWLDTPIRIRDCRLQAITEFVIQGVTWSCLALTLLGIEQVIALSWKAYKHGHIRWVSQIASGNVPMNSYFLFTVIMVWLYVRTDNIFGAQGRNWLPFMLPIFWTSLVFAPKALRLPALRYAARAFLVAGLIFYSTVGSYYALRTIQLRYYLTPVEIKELARRRATVRCVLGNGEFPHPLRSPVRMRVACPVDTMDGIEVRLGSAGIVSGSVKVQLRGANDSLLAESEMDAGKIGKMGHQLFPFAPGRGLLNKPVSVEVSFDAASGSSGDVFVYVAGSPTGGFCARAVREESAAWLDPGEGDAHFIGKDTLPRLPVPLINQAGESVFVCPVGMISGVKVLLCAVGNRAAGSVVLELDDEDGRMMASATVPARQIGNQSSYHWFPLGDIKGVMGRRLRLRLLVDSLGKSAETVNAFKTLDQAFLGMVVGP